MPRIYFELLLAVVLLFSINIYGQISFVEDNTVPFIDVTLGDADFADVNGDGYQDVLITGLNSGTTYANLYLNDGSGNFVLVAGTPFTPVYESTVDFADVDGDGDMDVLITGEDGGGISGVSELYINNGTGVFTIDAGSSFTGILRGDVEFADVDNDGDLDVLLQGSNGATGVIELYINNGSGIFTLSTQPFIPVDTYPSIAISDIDGDNDLDILMSGRNGGVGQTYLYRNDGTGNYTLVAGTPFAGVTNAAIGFADIDNDGDQLQVGAVVVIYLIYMRMMG